MAKAKKSGGDKYVTKFKKKGFTDKQAKAFAKNARKKGKA